MINFGSGSKAAGGSSRKVLEKLSAITPNAMAMDRENTAMNVSFQCFPRIRTDRRARMELIVPLSAPHPKTRDPARGGASLSCSIGFSRCPERRLKPDAAS